MAAETSTTPSPKKETLMSLDTWAVAIALLLALAVKLNLFGKVPW
jgi:hypothetical protein